MRDTSRPTVQNSLQPRPAAEGPPVAGRVRADGAPPLCGGGLGGNDGQGRWGRGAQSLLGVRLEFPPRATGAGVSQRSWTTGPDLALRREARGLLVEVMEAQASCGGPGATPPGRATNMLSVLFTLPHRPEPPSGPNRPRAQRGGAFVPWMFAGPFPSAESSPHPFPLESPVLSLQVGQRLGRVRRLRFGCLSCPETLKTQDVWPLEAIWTHGEEQAAHSSSLSFPPGPSTPLPRPGPAGSPGARSGARERQG